MSGKAQSKIIKCKKCKKVYLAFDGLKYNKAEEQPCPHCLSEEREKGV